jgi:hypothetical protein
MFELFLEPSRPPCLPDGRERSGSLRRKAIGARFNRAYAHVALRGETRLAAGIALIAAEHVKDASPSLWSMIFSESRFPLFRIML